VFAQLIQDPGKINYIENPAKPAEIDQWGQLPKLASTFDHVDGLFYFTYIVCIFFFCLILGVLLFSVVKYRRKTWDQPAAANTTHNTPLEVVWTVIPLIIVMVMFAWGFKGCMDMTTVPEAASRNSYKATASQWSWLFTYPDQSTSSGELWLEVDKPVQFYLESTDVLHAFYMPSMRVKRDVVPGRFQSVWFTPKFTKTFAPGEKQEEEFHLFCAEYCGNDHSRMYAKVHVVGPEEFAKRPWDTWEDATPEQAVASAERLYKSRGCNTCHALDGTKGTGPGWGGPNSLFKRDGDKVVGRQRDVLEGGQRKTITVDDAYIIESITKPTAKLNAEFPAGGMADFPDLDPARASDAKLAERKLKAIIELMKSDKVATK
jgi:cytochrome c oxidase subunit II